jgi:hypothetical protein
MAENCPYYRREKCNNPTDPREIACSFQRRDYENCSVYILISDPVRGRQIVHTLFFGPSSSASASGEEEPNPARHIDAGIGNVPAKVVPFLTAASRLWRREKIVARTLIVLLCGSLFLAVVYAAGIADRWGSAWLAWLLFFIIWIGGVVLPLLPMRWILLQRYRARILNELETACGCEPSEAHQLLDSLSDMEYLRRRLIEDIQSLTYDLRWDRDFAKIDAACDDLLRQLQQMQPAAHNVRLGNDNAQLLQLCAGKSPRILGQVGTLFERLDFLLSKREEVSAWMAKLAGRRQSQLSHPVSRSQAQRDERQLERKIENQA